MVKAKFNRLLIDKLKAECLAQDSFVAAYREKQAAAEGATDPDPLFVPVFRRGTRTSS